MMRVPSVSLGLVLIVVLGVLAHGLVSSAARAEDHPVAAEAASTPGEAFENLPASAVIEQAIGIADLAFGIDPDGIGETLHFTGPVKVQKWPMEGYTRTVLSDGRVQITAEIVDRDKGMLLARCAESFQLKAPVTITVAPGYPWEGSEGDGTAPAEDGKPAPQQDVPAPEEAKDEVTVAYRAPRPGDAARNITVSEFARRSTGTITQMTPGVDFPAQVEMDLYLNLHTPVGVLHNEEPLELRSIIDGIPPVKVDPVSEDQNEWHAANMPIRFVNDDGETMAWMTTRAHAACLVHPDVITQAEVEAELAVQVDGREEKVTVRGMTEIHRYEETQGSERLEMVQLYLDGESELLGGPVTLTAPNNGCRRVPLGQVASDGTWFDVPFVLKTNNGVLQTSNMVRILSQASTRFPDFGAVLHGGSDHPLVTEDGKRIGNLDTVDLRLVGSYERPPVPGVVFMPPAVDR